MWLCDYNRQHDEFYENNKFPHAKGCDQHLHINKQQMCLRNHRYLHPLLRTLRDWRYRITKIREYDSHHAYLLFRFIDQRAECDFYDEYQLHDYLRDITKVTSPQRHYFYRMQAKDLNWEAYQMDQHFRWL
jgi:hypothetical protein